MTPTSPILFWLLILYPLLTSSLSPPAPAPNPLPLTTPTSPHLTPPPYSKPPKPLTTLPVPSTDTTLTFRPGAPTNPTVLQTLLQHAYSLIAAQILVDGSRAYLPSGSYNYDVHEGLMLCVWAYVPSRLSWGRLSDAVEGLLWYLVEQGRGVDLPSFEVTSTVMGWRVASGCLARDCALRVGEDGVEVVGVGGE